jgi:hypothetical protein
MMTGQLTTTEISIQFSKFKLQFILLFQNKLSVIFFAETEPSLLKRAKVIHVANSCRTGHSEKQRWLH